VGAAVEAGMAAAVGAATATASVTEAGQAPNC
jgi:hypothetical protein